LGAVVAEIVIVSAELGGTLVEDGTDPGVMVGGPADDAVLDLPARGRFTPAVVRLTVDGGPVVKYFRSSHFVRPGAPELYCWDWEVPAGVAERSVAWPIGARIAQLARHQWTGGPYAVPPRCDVDIA
jgi:hypothetical protein